MDAMKDFFEPSSVAVVGASRTPGKGGNTVVANMLEFGYSGRIYPVNPSAGEVFGLKAERSVGGLPSPPDLVVAVLPRARTLDLMVECARAGVRNAIIPAAGFSDAGAEGRALQDEVLRVARAAGIRVMGPNSIGTIDTSSGLATSIVTLEGLKPGGVSLFGQTGMFASGIARWINSSEHFGVRRIACLGNKADVDENDLLQHLAGDGGTRVIGMYTEGVADGARFSSVLKKTASRKPVLILKSGRSETGVKAIGSHTGALAGSDSVYSGVIEQAGAVRVGGFEEMFDCAKMFEWMPLPAGDGLGVVSITGVGCVLSADAAGRYGLRLPDLSPGTIEAMRRALPGWAPAANPADIWAGIEGGGARSTYGVVADAMAADREVDMLLLIFTLIPESFLDAADLFAGLRERFPGVPVAAVLMAGEARMRLEWKRSIESMGVPTYDSPERAVRAMGALSRYATGRRRERGTAP